MRSLLREYEIMRITEKVDELERDADGTDAKILKLLPYDTRERVLSLAVLTVPTVISPT